MVAYPKYVSYTTKYTIWKGFCGQICLKNVIYWCMALWNVAHQAPLSVGFSRQEYWSELSFLQEIFPTQGSNLRLLGLWYWQEGLLPLGSATWEAH